MDKTTLIIQNSLREATVSLERAHLIYCDENWKCDYSVCRQIPEEFPL